jgi:polyhydroxyalkanoate synthesis repressor PhaR
VLLGTAFVVIDKKTDQDITRTILLQVIIEQEQHGEPIMSQDFLAQVIRAHGKMDGRMVPDFRGFAGARGGPPDDGAGHRRATGEDRKKAG